MARSAGLPTLCAGMIARVPAHAAATPPPPAHQALRGERRKPATSPRNAPNDTDLNTPDPRSARRSESFSARPWPRRGSFARRTPAPQPSAASGLIADVGSRLAPDVTHQGGRPSKQCASPGQHNGRFQLSVTTCPRLGSDLVGLKNESCAIDPAQKISYRLFIVLYWHLVRRCAGRLET